ncbi:MAG: U32 family peptidase [Desulfovibrionales bacterium]|jgi:putative protease|nr:U32 family peptidase [Desulfovibrionales bacterium]
MTFLPELLVPVADPDKLDTALRYGADAVYLGGQALNLRSKTGGFSFDQLRQAVIKAHKHGVKVYFTLNLLAWEKHLHQVADYLHELADSDVDALIIADPGILDMARSKVPHIPIHLSTQANTSNSASAHFWHTQGVQRVNIARELGARDIRAIAQNTPDLELEVFVHGAMCMAISGRCLLSAYLTGRSGNLGACTHPCRFDYKVTGLRLEERLRPDRDTWELYEDATYSRIMSAEDLCLIKYLPWFCKVGIHSLKLEGRMKTTSYLAQVTDIYRTALLDLHKGQFQPHLYLDELQQVATRPLATGFFTASTKVLRPVLPLAVKKHIVAQILEPVGQGLWLIDVKYRFSTNTDLEILCPGLRRPIIAGGDYGIEKQDGLKVSVAHGGVQLFLRCDHPDFEPGLYLRTRYPETKT